MANKDDHGIEPPEADLDGGEATEAASDDRSPAEGAQHDDDATRAAKAEDQLRRAMADLANFQRRRIKEIDETRQRTLEAVTGELLPVLDNFHLALGATEQGERQDGFDVQTIVEGMRMVRSMLESVLERHGLSEIRTAGEKFDPALHEAVGVDQESDADPGTVTRVVQRGYRLGDKILRPSRVMVRPDESPTD